MRYRRPADRLAKRPNGRPIEKSRATRAAGRAEVTRRLRRAGPGPRESDLRGWRPPTPAGSHTLRRVTCVAREQDAANGNSHGRRIRPALVRRFGSSKTRARRPPADGRETQAKGPAGFVNLAGRPVGWQRGAQLAAPPPRPWRRRGTLAGRPAGIGSRNRFVRARADRFAPSAGRGSRAQRQKLAKQEESRQQVTAEPTRPPPSQAKRTSHKGWARHARRPDSRPSAGLRNRLFAGPTRMQPTRPSQRLACLARESKRLPGAR